jgi:hypothetical protein
MAPALAAASVLGPSRRCAFKKIPAWNGLAQCRKVTRLQSSGVAACCLVNRGHPWEGRRWRTRTTLDTEARGSAEMPVMQEGAIRPPGA